MTLRIGLIGCGNISDIYLINAPRFPAVRFVACADLKPEAARRQAETYGIEALGVSELLARDDIDVVLNLTIPAAHAEISLAALESGKHVYSEKPLASTLADGIAIVEAARARDLRVGSAPDTVLGAAIQAARQQIDAGTIGLPFPSGTQWAWLAALLAVPGTGHFLMNWSHLHVPLSLTGLMTLGIPVISAAGAWAALDQAVTATQGVGMAIVIGVLVLVVRRDARSTAATGAS